MQPKIRTKPFSNRFYAMPILSCRKNQSCHKHTGTSAHIRKATATGDQSQGTPGPGGAQALMLQGAPPGTTAPETVAGSAGTTAEGITAVIAISALAKHHTKQCRKKCYFNPKTRNAENRVIYHKKSKKFNLILVLK